MGLPGASLFQFLPSTPPLIDDLPLAVCDDWPWGWLSSHFSKWPLVSVRFFWEKDARIFPTAGSLTGRFVRHFTFCLHFSLRVQSLERRVAATPTRRSSCRPSKAKKSLLSSMFVEERHKNIQSNTPTHPPCLFDCHVTVCYR